MTKKDLLDLIEKAKSATPGPWVRHQSHIYGRNGYNGSQVIVAKITYQNRGDKTDEFIASVNPTVVLDLCQRILGLQEALEKIADNNRRPCFLTALRAIAQEALEKFGLKEEK